MDDPEDRPRDEGAGDNPFAGTPFEQIFKALGGGASAGGGTGFGGAFGGDLSGLMGQIQAMMTPYDGPVNWTLATDIARRTAAQEPDPSPDSNDQSRVADSIRLADHWLDDVTVLPSGVTTTAAWSRAEWIEQTTEVWRVLVEPVAEHVVAAMGKAMPEEAKAMAGPRIGRLGKAGGAMFGSQVGAALGGLAGEVLTASDVGLPLGPAGKAALVPHNIKAFAEGLDVTEDDILLAVLDAGAQEVNDIGEKFEVVCESSDINAVRDALKDAEIDYDSIELDFRASMEVPADATTAKKVFNLIDALEDSDDVQNVFTNMNMPDDVLAELDSE